MRTIDLAIGDTWFNEEGREYVVTEKILTEDGNICVTSATVPLFEE